MSEKRQVMVTGAAGFLGRHVCTALSEQGHHVLGVVRRPNHGPWHETHQLDLTEKRAFDGLCEGVDVVLHLAAKTHAAATSPDDEQDYQRLNVEMTGNLVDAAVANGVRSFVMMSSVKVLGEGSAVPLTENDAPRPTTAYGRTKQAAEKLVHAAGQEHGMHTAVIRAPLMYGPGVKGNLQNMMQAIAAGRFPPLPETHNRRSLVDVRDVARALLLAADSPAAKGRTYTVTDNQEYSTRQMQDLMRRALGKKPLNWSLPYFVLRGLALKGDFLHRLGLPFPFDSVTCEKLLGSAIYSSQAIKEELDFAPRYSLDQALPEMTG